MTVTIAGTTYEFNGWNWNAENGETVSNFLMLERMRQAVA